MLLLLLSLRISCSRSKYLGRQSFCFCPSLPLWFYSNSRLAVMWSDDWNQERFIGSWPKKNRANRILRFFSKHGIAEELRKSGSRDALVIVLVRNRKKALQSFNWNFIREIVKTLRSTFRPNPKDKHTCPKWQSESRVVCCFNLVAVDGVEEKSTRGEKVVQSVRLSPVNEECLGKLSNDDDNNCLDFLYLSSLLLLLLTFLDFFFSSGGNDFASIWYKLKLIP